MLVLQDYDRKRTIKIKNYKNQKVKETAKIITAKGNIIYEAEIKGKDIFFDNNGNLITKDKIS